MSETPNKPRRPRRPMSITTLLKRANSTATSRHGIGGMEKRRHMPKAITLPTIMCLQRRAPYEDGAL